ncbi:MAG: SRPBCC family protein [Proteobacteria bacterium]|nr:SRPBCC family protein [Pseudomonadota bacterium]
MAHVIATRPIPVPASRVWALITDFDRLPDWHHTVSEVTAENANRGLGARTRLATYDGGTMVQEVSQLDEARRVLSLDVFELPMPFASMQVEFRVEAADPDSCTVYFEADYALSGGIFGATLDVLLVRSAIRKEHDSLLECLEDHLLNGVFIGNKGARLPAPVIAKAG